MSSSNATRSLGTISLRREQPQRPSHPAPFLINPFLAVAASRSQRQPSQQCTGVAASFLHSLSVARSRRAPAACGAVPLQPPAAGCAQFISNTSDPIDTCG